MHKNNCSSKAFDTFKTSRENSLDYSFGIPNNN